MRIVWNDGTGIQDILKLLAHAELDTGLQGKGVVAGWPSCTGPRSNVIALHDCDDSANRVLARLCYPIVNLQPGLRVLQVLQLVTNRSHGRVTRPYFTPLIRKLKQVVVLVSSVTDLRQLSLSARRENLPWCGIA